MPGILLCQRWYFELEFDRFFVRNLSTGIEDLDTKD
jgi:hypothetical protein